MLKLSPINEVEIVTPEG